MKKIIFFLFIGFTVQSQGTDYRILKHITENRNIDLNGTILGLSNSVSFVNAGLPLTLIGVGLLSHQKTTIHKGIYLGISAAMSGLTGTGIKYGIKRQRPYEKHIDIIALDNPHTPSFPSGHTSAAFNTATSVTLMYPKWYVAAPAYAWAAGSAYSRMHLGVHYPSDVLAGIVVGTGTAVLTKWLNKKMHIL